MPHARLPLPLTPAGTSTGCSGRRLVAAMARTEAGRGLTTRAAPCRLVEQLGLRLLGSIYTHKHFDHIGGGIPRMMTGGRDVVVEGAAEVLAHQGLAAGRGAGSGPTFCMPPWASPHLPPAP